MRKTIKPTIIILIIIIVLSNFIGCNIAKPKKYSYEFFDTFDTIVQVIGYSTSEKEFSEYTDYAHSRFQELHALFDIYNDHKNINTLKTVNDNAGVKPVDVDPVIIDLVKFSIDKNKTLSSKVNIAMGPVLRIWHDYRNEGINTPKNAKLPTKEELEKASSLTNIDDIVIDKSKSTIFLKRKGMMLDVGAVAKGFATEIVTKELQEKGFDSFLISGGGNVKTIGNQLNKDSTLWSIGIQNPFYLENDKETNLMDAVYITDTSVVTSGDYQRFYTVDGEKYHHLIDPITLMPETLFSSVTVMAEDSALADYFSTALF
jgi:thiamine biosynthesis lipoprotein